MRHVMYVLGDDAVVVTDVSESEIANDDVKAKVSIMINASRQSFGEDPIEIDWDEVAVAPFYDHPEDKRGYLGFKIKSFEDKIST